MSPRLPTCPKGSSSYCPRSAKRGEWIGRHKQGEWWNAWTLVHSASGYRPGYLGHVDETQSRARSRESPLSEAHICSANGEP